MIKRSKTQQKVKSSLNDKTLLTDQEVDSFVEDQGNPNSEASKEIRVSASLLSFFKNHPFWRNEVTEIPPADLNY